MFSRGQILALALLFVLSIAFRLGPLVILTLLLLLSAALAWCWKAAVLSHISYNQELSQHHAFPDDMVELAIQIVNHKLLPITALHVQEHATIGLDWSGAQRAQDWRPTSQTLQRVTSLGAYESVRWRYQLRCPHRGTFRFGPTTLEAGDPFGFTLRQLQLAKRAELVVYPRVLPLAELGLASGRPLGDSRSRHWLFTDPAHTAGARDYRFGDPLKSIHWPTTARRGSLQTRIYEPTMSLDLMVFLDLDTVQHAWEGRRSAAVERAISAAATVVQAGLAERYSAGISINGMLEFQSGLVNIPPSCSPAQLTQIFDALARVVPYALLPMPELLQQATATLPTGATVLVISVIAPNALQTSLLRIRDHGHPTIWLYLGEDSPPVVPGVQVQHAPSPAMPTSVDTPATSTGAS
ncbi:MAG: DUF58 domain-containing protein [Herpetosiphonaceae bacterium]|nr:DUF58 domain-containing protein [Herpetosiphonaceae bacterium]